MKNEKLKKALDDEILERGRYLAKSIAEAQETIRALEPFADLLDAAGIEYHASPSALFVSTPYDEPRTKPVFSEHVRRVSLALGAVPDVYVGEGQYRATFCEGKVWVSVYSPEDCQLIEVEETVTRKVTKPHPACVAALGALEDAVF